MSIITEIKDLQINELLNFIELKDSTANDLTKFSNTFVVSTKKIYYLDKDDFKLIPEINFKKKNKVLTQYLGIPDKKEGIDYKNKAKQHFEDAEGHIALKCCSLNLQNIKDFSIILGGINRLAHQNYDFICFQDINNFNEKMGGG